VDLIHPTTNQVEENSQSHKVALLKVVAGKADFHQGNSRQTKGLQGIVIDVVVEDPHAARKCDPQIQRKQLDRCLDKWQ